MKKGIVISIFCITAGLFSHSVYADTPQIKSIKLKAKCIKQNPLAANQTDQALLGIYQQVCDKDNAANVNDLLAKAAMRMYELKQPMNALRLATELQEQNIRGTTLTDVTFLASVDIANQAIQRMRSSEMRYLSNELTYPPARKLNDNILAALPAPEPFSSTPITDESVKKVTRNISSNNTTRRASNKKVRKTASPTAVKRQAAATPKVTKPTNTKQQAAPNPFDSLK